MFIVPRPVLAVVAGLIVAWLLPQLADRWLNGETDAIDVAAATESIPLHTAKAEERPARSSWGAGIMRGHRSASGPGREQDGLEGKKEAGAGRAEWRRDASRRRAGRPDAFVVGW